MKHKNNEQGFVKIHPDLALAQKLAYESAGLISTNIIPEVESQEYGAFDFEMNRLHIKFRVAKTTPTKIGQFVTLWKRIEKGPIQPYDLADPFDLYVVSVRSFQNFGQFVFPKMILYEKGILSKEGSGGKRALRVYPGWDITDNRQAKNTQTWQLQYFYNIPFDESLDIHKVHRLFS